MEIEKLFEDNHAPKRPKSVKSKVIRFNNNKEKWIAFVGLIDNKPYEIFTGKLDDLSLPTSIPKTLQISARKALRTNLKPQSNLLLIILMQDS